MTLREGEKYITLECGCQFNDAHYEDVVYGCSNHKEWGDIKGAIANYIRNHVRKLAQSAPIIEGR
jgi:hypothetical protein